MTTLVTSDWHLNDKPRDNYRHEWQPRLRKLCADHNVGTLVFLGDLTDEKDNHSSALVNRIIDHLSQLYDLCPRIILMRGNHDYVDPACPFFKFVEAMPGFEWINTPCVQELDGTRMQFLPHTRNFQVDWAEISFSGVDVCFAHNTFAGTISESGHELGGIPTTALPNDITVLSGDIHKPQTVGQVQYVGSPYTIDFGDSFQPRVILLKPSKHGPVLRSIACEGAQKRLVVAADPAQALRKLADLKGDIIKLRVAVPTKNKDAWPTTKRKLVEDATALGVHVHSVEALLEQSEAARRYRVSSGKARRDDEVLKAYCKQRGIEDKRLYTALEIVKS